MSIGAISGGAVDYAVLRQQPNLSARFEEDDADKSGGLSLQEFQTAHAGSARPTGPGGANRAGGPSASDIFAELDEDEDGELSLAELEAGKPPPPQGGLASGTLASLLSVQEADEETSILSLQTTGSYAANGSESDPIGELLDSLSG